MFFTSLTESGYVIFNESSIKNDRRKVINDTKKLIKAELKPEIKKYISSKNMITDKDDLNDFLNGECEFINIMGIKGWTSESKKTAGTKNNYLNFNNNEFKYLQNICKAVNKKLPKGYSVEPLRNGDDDKGSWVINLEAPKIKL